MRKRIRERWQVLVIQFLVSILENGNALVPVFLRASVTVHVP
jgi:hypothetical protein